MRNSYEIVSLPKELRIGLRKVLREAGSAYILSVGALGRVRGIFRETKTTLNPTERPLFTQDHFLRSLSICNLSTILKTVRSFGEKALHTVD